MQVGMDRYVVQSSCNQLLSMFDIFLPNFGHQIHRPGFSEPKMN
jgi:hypothetical protein